MAANLTSVSILLILVNFIFKELSHRLGGQFVIFEFEHNRFTDAFFRIAAYIVEQRVLDRFL